MPYIQVEKGVFLYVEDLDPGTGNTILFLHGWPVNHRLFEYQFDQLPKYGYRCIGVDLRGFGKSSKPWSGYTYDRFSDDVRVVVETLRLRDFTLAGFSIGGAIAIRYMARHRGYGVKKFCLLSPAAPVFTKRPDYPYGKSKEEINELLMQTEKDRPKMLADFGEDFFASAVSPEFREWFTQLGLQASGHGTAKALLALRDEDVRQDLPAIRVPTGIFHGALDRIVPYESAMVLNKAIRGSELHRFEHSGHGVVYDELERFNRVFLQYVHKQQTGI